MCQERCSYREPDVPSRFSCASDWHPRHVSAKEVWKHYSGLLEFASNAMMPRLRDHCELLLMGFLYYYRDSVTVTDKNNALSYVFRASGKKVFENIHKLGMFKVLSEFPKHISSPDWMKLTELEIMFIRNNYHHFKLATELRVRTAILVWCGGTTNDASEAREKFNRIRLNRV